MLDINLIREQPEVVRTSLRDRQMDPGIVDEVAALDMQRRALLGQVETLKAERNAASKEISKMKDPAERNLFDALRNASQKATPLFDAGDYTGYLMAFAILKAPVDAFFESVMVMVDDENLRRNRLALLQDLRDEMNRVADISKLAA